jgi:hypothetical protein
MPSGAGGARQILEQRLTDDFGEAGVILHVCAITPPKREITIPPAHIRHREAVRVGLSKLQAVIAHVRCINP